MQETTTDARPAETGRSATKRRAILAAAEEAFLRDGYVGTNMDEIAAVARVSKPTVYRHFGSKEALFVELVTEMTHSAGDPVLAEMPAPRDVDELRELLAGYALRQLEAVLTPRILRVRRLVIGEVARFPELARALHDAGPRRAIAALTGVFAAAAERGLLAVPDPGRAAEQFNWLVMGEPLNRAMLLGDAAIPGRAELLRHARAGTDLILAAYRT